MQISRNEAPPTCMFGILRCVASYANSVMPTYDFDIQVETENDQKLIFFHRDNTLTECDILCEKV